MALFDPYAEIPGYGEAVTRENEMRDIAFLGLPEWICDFPVKPLTCRHLLWLEMVQSPFLYSLPVEKLLEKPDIAMDVRRFMWIVSFEFEPLNLRKQHRFFRKYSRTFEKNKTQDVLDGIHDYIDEAFADAPGGAEKVGKRYYSDAAVITHILSGEYAMPVWEPEPGRFAGAIRRWLGIPPSASDVPLKIAFQLLKVRRKFNNPKAILFNHSDDIISRWCEQTNLTPSANN